MKMLLIEYDVFVFGKYEHCRKIMYDYELADIDSIEKASSPYNKILNIICQDYDQYPYEYRNMISNIKYKIITIGDSDYNFIYLYEDKDDALIHEMINELMKLQYINEYSIKADIKMCSKDLASVHICISRSDKMLLDIKFYLLERKITGRYIYTTRNIPVNVVNVMKKIEKFDKNIV